MNICVTGSHGFVGKNLMERLESHTVSTFNRNDCLDLDNVEVVIHLIADANSRESNTHIIRSISDNIGCFARVLDESVKQKVRRIIYVSSIEAETEHNIYAIAKRTCEKMLQTISKETGIEYVIIRPCNLYGPYMDLSDKGRNVVANFLTSIKSKSVMNIQESGKKYPFTYVGVLINYILDSLTTYTNQTINVGTTMGITVTELATFLDGITNTWEWVKHEN